MANTINYSGAAKAGAGAFSKATHNLPKRSSSQSQSKQNRTTRTINEGASQISQGQNSRQDRYPSQIYEPKDYNRQSTQESQRQLNQVLSNAKNFANESAIRQRSRDSQARRHEKELLQMQLRAQNPTGRIVSASSSSRSAPAGISNDLKLARENANSQEKLLKLQGRLNNKAARKAWRRDNYSAFQSRTHDAQQAQADRTLAAWTAASEQRNRLAAIGLENKGRIDAAKIAAQGNLYSSWFQGFNPIGNAQSYKYW